MERNLGISTNLRFAGFGSKWFLFGTVWVRAFEEFSGTQRRCASDTDVNTGSTTEWPEAKTKWVTFADCPNDWHKSAFGAWPLVPDQQDESKKRPFATLIFFVGKLKYTDECRKEHCWILRWVVSPPLPNYPIGKSPTAKVITKVDLIKKAADVQQLLPCLWKGAMLMDGGCWGYRQLSQDGFSMRNLGGSRMGSIVNAFLNSSC